MQSIDILKRARAPKRAIFTRLSTEFWTEIEKPDFDVEKYRSKYNRICALSKEISEINSRYHGLLLEDETITEVKIEEEFEGFENYVQGMFDIKNKYLSRCETVRVRVDGSLVESAANSVVNTESKRTIRLPKVELPKLKGNLEDWLSWWGQFSKINDDETLGDVDKFHYLLQAVVEGSRAQRLVCSYPITEYNYPKVIQALKDRFGEKNLLIEHYIRILLKLVVSNARKENIPLDEIYDDLMAYLKNLESLGVWQRNPAVGYGIKEEGAENGDKSDASGRLQALMDFLRDEVKGAERMAFSKENFEANSSMRATGSQLKTPRKTPPTASNLFGSAFNRKCIFCQRDNHLSSEDVVEDGTIIFIHIQLSLEAISGGSDYFGQLLTGKVVHLGEDLTAVETKLRWTLMGQSPVVCKEDKVKIALNMLVARNNLKDLWELDVLGIQDFIEVVSKKKRETELKEHFIKNIKRDEDKRYSVALPWKCKRNNIPSNLEIAQRRLEACTKWERKGLIERIEENRPQKKGIFLPHRPVFKAESRTTPLLPVFDASCRSYNDLSRNDYLEKGPNLLEKIPEILIRFGEKGIGVLADVRKAFQMITLQHKDQDFLRFLWWDQTDPMKNTAVNIMEMAKMDLREWEFNLPRSNSKEEKGTTTKVLGLVWDKVEDVLNSDLPSRGCSIVQFVSTNWWEGPEWLKGEKESWPSFEPTIDEEEIIKEKRKTLQAHTNLIVEANRWFLDRRSKAERKLLKLVQQETFPGKQAPKNGLKAIKSVEGLWCVETKLLHGQDSEVFKRHILLPRNHPLVEQMVREIHQQNGHGGAQFILSQLREKFWIIGGRRFIKQIIGKCVICRWHNQKPIQTLGAALPTNRIGLGKPFEVTGVDLLGPLHLKGGSKVWVALCTCAVYRAVNLEIVRTLEANTFY
ncbi:hypothetical protein LAZ67_5002612 [Cordylochernes scorpioides]|uniref:Integrase zinc-binding domain-containing protein n=1 Tax=Cordylochernes scorpioides TaxID=51811 RepID=A0ABY6KGT4_9ARAC|nr:hypothetical protein LAZ67_5002612 [Cordylochernes scorpioides]